jgi:exodeoxyribonuclease VIII
MNSIEILPSQYHTELMLDRSDIFSADSWLSKSAVFELYQSSLYKWRYHPRVFKPTPNMAWGSLVDTIITAPEDLKTEFAISPFDSYRSKDAREWKAEQEANYKTIITTDLLDEAHKAVKVLTKTHKYAAQMIEKSKRQVMLLNTTQHPSVERDINLKGLVDLAPEGEPFLMDLKTTADFGADGFQKTVAKFGYHVQAALYLQLWNSLHPNDQRHRFQIVWQQSAAPYEVAVTEIPETDIADGLDMFNYLLGKLCRASNKNYWPMKFEKPIVLGRAMFGHYADELEMEQPTEAPK